MVLFTMALLVQGGDANLNPVTGIISGSYLWFSARLQYLQGVSNGDTAVLH